MGCRMFVIAPTAQYRLFVCHGDGWLVASCDFHILPLSDFMSCVFKCVFNGFFASYSKTRSRGPDRKAMPAVGQNRSQFSIRIFCSQIFVTMKGLILGDPCPLTIICVEHYCKSYVLCHLWTALKPIGIGRWSGSPCWTQECLATHAETFKN